MEVIESIKDLDLSQKMLLMEKLWDDLSKEEAYATPSWHIDVLSMRENGDDFITLEESKERLEKLLK